MRTIYKVIFPFAFIILSFCTNTSNNSDAETKNIMDADKIQYTFHDGSLAPKYYRGYTIIVTPGELKISINSYGDTLLTRKRDFTQQKFEEVKSRLKEIKKDGDIQNRDIPDGGSSTFIFFYKGNKILFEGDNYSGRIKNYKDADIDLAYLVPDLQDLISSTRKSNNLGN